MRHRDHKTNLDAAFDRPGFVTLESADAEFSPALGLVYHLVRVALGTDELISAVLPQTQSDWQIAGRELARQRVGPFLLANLPDAVIAALPGYVLLPMRRSREVTGLHAARQNRELVQLSRLFGAADLPLLSLKGPLLSLELYGALDLRHGSDLDIGVAPTDAIRADAVLRQAGYVRLRPGFGLTTRQEREYLRSHYEFEYRVPGSSLRVELLWRLEGVPDLGAAWTGGPRHVIDGVTVPTPPAALNFLYLCAHGARHGWCRLFWLLDIALLLRRDELNWSDLARQARVHGVERSVLQAGALARDLLGVRLPAAFQPRDAAETRLIASLAREACRQIALQPHEENGTREWCRQLCYRLRLPSDWPARRAVLRPHLFSLASWETVRLPDRWFVLYHVLTPFLWLWRQLRAARSRRLRR